jgi:hypothetical protein
MSQNAFHIFALVARQVPVPIKELGFISHDLAPPSRQKERMMAHCGGKLSDRMMRKSREFDARTERTDPPTQAAQRDQFFGFQ